MRLPCDFGTGYLGAIGAMSALRQRQEQGGFWNVEATLAGTMMQALSLPPEKEAAVAVSNDDMLKYLIDQKSDLNGATFTRLAPGARLSEHTVFRCDGSSDPGSSRSAQDDMGSTAVQTDSGAASTVCLRKRGTEWCLYGIWARRHHAAEK